VERQDNSWTLIMKTSGSPSCR